MRALAQVLRQIQAQCQKESTVFAPWYLDSAETEQLTQVLEEAEYKLIQKRKESDPNFKSLEASPLQAAVLIQSLAIIQQLMQKQQFEVRPLKQKRSRLQKLIPWASLLCS